MKTKLKNLIPFALILFFLPVSALAYDKDHKQKNLEKKMDHLEERLNLDSAQKEALKPILSEMMEKRRALLKDLHEKSKVAMTAINAEEDAKLKGILNADQMKAFSKMREKKRGKDMDRHHKKEKNSSEKQQ